MGKHYPLLPSHLRSFISSQELFFVATAPLSGGSAGHVNVSPKGLRGSLHLGADKDKDKDELPAVVDEDGYKQDGEPEHGKEEKWIDEVWYEDLTGSGCETIAHLREEGNGRITVMVCAFEGAPMVVRMYGIGTVHEFGTPEYDSYVPPETRRPGSRAVIVVKINKVGTSCGWGIPFYSFTGHRRRLLSFASMLESRDNTNTTSLSQPAPLPPPTANTNKYSSLKTYWRLANTHSIDGIPGLDTCLSTTKELRSRDVREMVEDGGLVGEEVERAGGVAVSVAGGRRGGGVGRGGGLGVKERVKTFLAPGGEETRVALGVGFVLGIVACGLVQEIMRTGIGMGIGIGMGPIGWTR